MAVELVVKLSEKDVEHIKRLGALWIESERGLSVVSKALLNGTILPKGHGKLITEPTEEEIAETIGGKNDFADCIREAVKTVFANASTVIEADKVEPQESEE